MNEKSLILIVDDEPEILELYSRKLERSGFDVVTAPDGLAGIQAAKAEKRPDLILMDVKMPGMDGVEAFMELKKESATKDIKVVFLTAFSDLKGPEFDEKIAQEVGASGFIKKGIDLDDFINRIKEILQKP